MTQTARRATVARPLTAPTPGLVEGSGQLLALVRAGRANTISELAAAMQVARSTILQRLEFLGRAGLVQSEAQQTGARGRPASLTRFAPGAAMVLSAHVGLTGCRTAIADLNGDIAADRLNPIDLTGGPSSLLQVIEDAFEALIRQSGTTADRLAGIGVGVPSSLELRGFARSLGVGVSDWDREYFRDQLARRYRVPVYLDLDVNLLALAEYRTSWPDAEVLVCVKLGTLIDAALVVRGVPIRGANNLAGELGHIKLDGRTEPCACGSVGCLDAVASGQALVRQLRATGRDVEHVREVVQLAEEGLPEAVRLIRAAGRAIGEALSAVVNLLNPAAISAWGYLAASEPLLAGVRESLYKMVLPGSSEQLRVVTTALGDQAGVRGAAMHVIDQLLEPKAVDAMLLTGSWAGAEVTSSHP